ncbi:hypothetical protein PCANC_03777 [Puccinia coronata f. sp. avenae]|uniref:Uncharacterized protein n=1 Tax=Puccinia coronata f. sp. avenae TaxID=200324 RepID=A0A2N5SVG1_9BASI|nr:hypothetical protein PCASD_16499 [Puccinia coronata f. sp. avenae]PLW43083.1 hypothetical protein PCASD_06058 [Puccinia coronata f. sp. avenae]PLW53937.1 hypothetical protein PCANC_03777 [Puccinia coronata f. sp. avenae]
MNSYFLGLIFCGIVVGQVVGSPVFSSLPFQFLFGTTLRDLGQYIRPQDLEVEVLDDLNPSLEFKVDQVLDQSSPETVRPIHQTLRRVREGTR